LLVVPAPGVRAMLQRQLEQWGMTVVAAAGAGDFLREGELQPVAADLILLDSALADPDALSLARQFKAHPEMARSRIILLTALGQRPSAAALRGAGGVACLAKPPRRARLFQCLVEVMRHEGEAPLPMLDETTVMARALADAAKKVRILVAEDNVVNQRVALKQLKKLGYRAEAVGNGREALEVLQRERFDIVLMDCQMPEVDGYEVTRRLRAAEVAQGQPPRYVVALTAHALSGDRERCLAAGMNDYLTKPLHLSDLETVLHRAVVQLQQPPPPPATSPEAVLDPAVLHGLRELREPGAPDPLQELVELFLRDARPKLEKMAAAAEKNDPSALAAAAHSLKGSASNLGARRLAALCGRLEKHAKSSEWTDAASLLLTVQSEFHLVETALVTEMQK
jgi:CheY-like chemotaxis protein/HPt (histidine-containing phosphotransfer) domain-containing protein